MCVRLFVCMRDWVFCVCAGIHCTMFFNQKFR